MGNLSESLGYSDSLVQVRRQPVRILGLFGLVCAGAMATCPNSWVIRTRWCRCDGNLSEFLGYSDSLMQVRWQPVRILGLFGLVCAGAMATCPHPWVIRTRLCRCDGNKSEFLGYSDSFVQVRWQPVRILGLFGPVDVGAMATSPHPWVIRTRWCRCNGNLSASLGYSDSLVQVRRQPVRILGLFGLVDAGAMATCPNS